MGQCVVQAPETNTLQQETGMPTVQMCLGPFPMGAAATDSKTVLLLVAAATGSGCVKQSAAAASCLCTGKLSVGIA